MLKSEAAALADALVDTVHAATPDFVVHCGDLTDNSTADEFAFALDAFDRMGCPYYLIPGNHDTYLPHIRAELAKRYATGGDHCYFASTLAGCRCYFLDGAYWVRTDGGADGHIDWDLYKAGGYVSIGVPEAEREWLAADLSAHAEAPALVFVHAPIASSPTFPIGHLPKAKPVTRTPSPYSDVGSYAAQHDALWTVLDAAPNVRAVFTGHWHLHDVVQHDAIAHVQTASMIEYPFELRKVTVEDGLLRIETLGLKDGRFKAASREAGLSNEWVAGAEGARSVEIRL
jgi:hypothetical protein